MNAYNVKTLACSPSVVTQGREGGDFILQFDTSSQVQLFPACSSSGRHRATGVGHFRVLES
jgi:hypothetical protein